MDTKHIICDKMHFCLLLRKVSHYWPGTCSNPPASVSQKLRLQEWATVPVSMYHSTQYLQWLVRGSFELSLDNTARCPVKKQTKPQNKKRTSWIQVVQTCNQNTWDAEAESSGIQGHPWLHSQPKAILGCMKPYLKNKTKQKSKIDKWMNR